MDKDDLIKVFTGSEVSVNHLKKELEDKGIGSLIKNYFRSGLSAGFSGGPSTTIDLFIQAEDFELAKPIIENFVKSLDK